MHLVKFCETVLEEKKQQFFKTLKNLIKIKKK